MFWLVVKSDVNTPWRWRCSAETCWSDKILSCCLCCMWIWLV